MASETQRRLNLRRVKRCASSAARHDVGGCVRRTLEFVREHKFSSNWGRRRTTGDATAAASLLKRRGGALPMTNTINELRIDIKAKFTWPHGSNKTAGDRARATGHRCNQRLALLILSGIVGLAGCKPIEDAKRLAHAVKTQSEGQAPPQAIAVQPSVPLHATTPEAIPREPSEAAQDAALAGKLGRYITCLNEVSGRSAESKSYYLKRIGNPKVGPTEGEQPRPPNELNTDSCLKALNEAAHMEPSMDKLDAEAADYKAALTELEPLIKEAHRYYDQRDYLDDRFAKGRELHPKLMAAWERFEKANDLFNADVTQLNDTVDARRLKRLATDPSERLQYLTLNAATEAKQLVKVSDVKQLAQLDLDKFEAALKSCEQAWNELEQYTAQHPDESSRVLRGALLENSAREFLKAAKELGRRKRDNKEFNHEFFSRNAPELVDGHPAQVSAKYNHLVNELNRMRF